MIERLSLKAKVLSMLMCLSLATVFLGGIVSVIFYKTVKSDKLGLLEGTAANISDKIDRNLFERYGDVQAFAVSEPARDLAPERLFSFIEYMMGTYAPIYDFMIVTNEHGKVIAVNKVDKGGKPQDNSALLGADMSQEPWFQKAISGEIKAGTTFVEDPKKDGVLSSKLNAQKPYMNFSAPIRNAKGQIIGVWSNRASWEDVVVEMMKSEIAKVKNDHIDELRGYIISSKGQFLLHPDASSDEAHGNFSPEAWAADSDHVAMLVDSQGFASYPSQGWKLALSSSTTDRVWDRVKWILVISLLVLTAVNVFAYVFLDRVIAKFVTVIEGMITGGKKLRDAAAQVQQASSRLSTQVQSQAAAIEETVASMEEVGSMLAQTAKQSEFSMQVSKAGYSASQESQDTIQEMSQSMQAIQESNAKLDEIIGLIEGIEQKTKVINDIVFETRLLSFNASIEAARAGVHGKGFAVVAEEVGKLALMSGTAADEIRSLLDNSTQAVGKVITEVRDRIQHGKGISEQAETEFQKLGKSLQQINEAVQAIAQAAKEQETGVQQTNLAMNEMDRATQANATGAESLAAQATQIYSISEDFQGKVEELKKVVFGQAA